MAANVLVGTWRLVSFEVKSPEGRVHFPLGKHPVGYIVYGDDGYMHVAMMKRDRARVRPEMLSMASVEERALAASSFISYCGRYEIQGSKVIHCVEASLDPNMTGQSVERFMKLDQGRLLLDMPPFPIFGELHTGHLVWQRA